jgi:hypothetical protein
MEANNIRIHGGRRHIYAQHYSTVRVSPEFDLTKMQWHSTHNLAQHCVYRRRHTVLE